MTCPHPDTFCEDCAELASCRLNPAVFARKPKHTSYAEALKAMAFLEAEREAMREELAELRPLRELVAQFVHNVQGGEL